MKLEPLVSCYAPKSSNSCLLPILDKIENYVERIVIRSPFRFLLIAVLTIMQPALHVIYAKNPTTQNSYTASNQVILAIPAKIKDPFWEIVKNGARDAAKIHGLDLQIFNYSSMNLADELHALDIVLSKPVGSLILVKYYDSNTMIESLKKYSRYSHFLQMINSGSSIFAKSDLLGNFTGMLDYNAGLALGKELIKFSPRRVLFISHLPLSNITTQSRLMGIQSSLSGKADVETLFLANEDEAIAQMNEGLDNFKEIDTVVFLGPVSFQYFVKATKSIPFWQQKTLTTFDLTKQIADYMLAGKVKVAIDQQPYLQGFYAVTNAALWNKYMVRPMGPIMTGPQVITPSIIPSIYNEIGTTR